MQLYVKTLDGRTLTLEVEPTWLVSSVKGAILDRFQLPTDQQRLIFNGRELPDEKTLASCNVTRLSTIHLIERMR